MLRMTDLAHAAIRCVVKPGDTVVDATVGNGHDTAFLAGLVGSDGRVFGFDVQELALQTARSRVGDLAQVRLIHAGHEELQARLPADAKGNLAAVMFNLGFLPGAPKEVITKPETTLAALRQALQWLKVGGLVSAVLYPGHEGGASEAEAVHGFAAALPSEFRAFSIARVNPSTAPGLLIFERVT